MSHASQQPEPDPSHPEGARPDGTRPDGSRPVTPDAAGAGPLAEEREGAARDPREHRPRINPARMEVRVRRIALLLLVLVPLIYFIVQSLR